MLQVIGCIEYKTYHEAKVGDQLENDDPLLNVPPFDLNESLHWVVREYLQGVSLSQLFIDQVDIITVPLEVFADVKGVKVQQADLNSPEILSCSIFNFVSDYYLILSPEVITGENTYCISVDLGNVDLC
jgi:hypothetical protein